MGCGGRAAPGPGRGGQRPADAARSTGPPLGRCVSLPETYVSSPGAVHRYTCLFEKAAGSPVSASASLTLILTITPAGPWGGHLGDPPRRATWEARLTQSGAPGTLPTGLLRNLSVWLCGQPRSRGPACPWGSHAGSWPSLARGRRGCVNHRAGGGHRADTGQTGFGVRAGVPRALPQPTLQPATGCGAAANGPQCMFQTAPVRNAGHPQVSGGNRDHGWRLGVGTVHQGPIF